MLLIDDDLNAVDMVLRTWFQSITNLLSVQPSDNPDDMTTRLQFDLLDVPADEFTAEELSINGDGDPILRVIQRYQLVYQIDILYERYGMQKLMELVRTFKTGQYRAHGDYTNLAYVTNSSLRRVGFMRNNALHYKHTVDLTFNYATQTETVINTMEVFNIAPCLDSGLTTNQTINKP